MKLIQPLPAVCLGLCLTALVPGCKDRAKAPGVKAAENDADAHEDEHAGHAHHEHASGGHDEGGHEDGEHADEVKLTAEAVERAGIRVEPATKRVLAETLIAPARVTFNEEAIAHVGTPLAGRATEIRVRTGDRVKKDDVLLILDSPELGEAQSDFLQKRAALATAGPAVELARSAYDRGLALFKESQGIALTEVQKREAEWKAAQGAVATAQAIATAAEHRLHLLGFGQEAVRAMAESGVINPRYEIRAPLQGEVIEREVTLGELAHPERESLLVIADMSSLWVVADVPEAKLGGIGVGSPARVQAAALGDYTIEGKVAYISPRLDPTTRTAAVRVEIQAAASGLRPGMFAQAEIAAAPTRAEAAPVLAVPEEAVHTVEGKPAVFVPVEGEEHTFAKRHVRTGRRVGRHVPILAGLREGEPVVVAGAFILKADLGKATAEHEH